MLNHVTLLGRLAQAPEIRQTQSGTLMARFDLAVANGNKDKNLPADFIPIVAWDKQAEFVQTYLAKGRQIVIEGRITTRKWTDTDGKNRKAVEVRANRIYFADSNTNTGAANPAPYQDNSYNYDYMIMPDEDVPF